MKKAAAYGKPIILYSAHGIPESFVEKGDPYPKQCEETVLALTKNEENILCYQSRLGPQKWTGPYIEDEIDRAALARRPIIVVPISFVSEHLETLVELKMDYKERALEKGSPYYVVLSTVGIDPDFIEGLANALTKTQRKIGRLP